MADRIARIDAERKTSFVHDPNGFFVIFLAREDKCIVVEHYSNVRKDDSKLEAVSGKLENVITGTEAEAICDTIIARGLVSRLDHAAYLGRELQKAEAALSKGMGYEQDAILE